MNAPEIKQAILDNNFFSIESLRAWAMLAAEIRAVKDTETRRELTREYEARFGRKVAVWARIPKRFDGVSVHTPNGFLALSYMCQLSEAKSIELYQAHCDHIDEQNAHLLVLQDVNAAKPRRARAERKTGEDDTAMMDWLSDNWSNIVTVATFQDAIEENGLREAIRMRMRAALDATKADA